MGACKLNAPHRSFAQGFADWRHVPKSAGCADQSVECTAWAAIDQCSLNKPFMRKRCPEACGLCGAAEAAIWPGSATEDGTRRFELAYWRMPEAHFRRDTAMGEFLLPTQRLRSNPWRAPMAAAPPAVAPPAAERCLAARARMRVRCASALCKRAAQARCASELCERVAAHAAAQALALAGERLRRCSGASGCAARPATSLRAC